MPDALEALKEQLRQFAKARDWEKFHTPKNLAMAMSVEAAELVEIFQWLTPEESAVLSPGKRQHLEEEISDVFIYLLKIADYYKIDMLEAAQRKMVKNAVKYPVGGPKL